MPGGFRSVRGPGNVPATREDRRDHDDVKVKLWRQAVDRHLVPYLPGSWHAAGWAVHQEPAGWLSRSVLASISAGGSFLTVTAVVQLFAAPRSHWVGDVSLELGRWSVPVTVEQAEPTMHDISRLVCDKAIAFFDDQATLNSRRVYLEQRVASLAERMGGGGWQDINVDEELTYVRLLLGDLAGAEQAAQWATHVVTAKPRSWEIEVNQRVQRVIAVAARDPGEAIAMLRDQAAWTRAVLRIPPMGAA